MAPILIDNRDLLKLGFVSVLTIVLAFAGGVMFGYQQATMGYDHEINSMAESSSLPEQKAISDIDIKQAPDIVNTAEKTDIDQIEPAKKSTDAKKSVAVISIKTEEKPNTVVKVNAVKEKAEKEKASAVNVTKDKKTATLPATSAVASDNNKIKYSIQVAVYGRLNNAENMMKKLQAQNLDAYVSDYLNKKNKLRFNVRFGYFKDKKTALKALSDYINIQKGDGYLVNYSADNIVDIAQQTSVDEEPEKKPEKIKQPDDIVPADIKPTSVTTTDAAPDNLSQVEKIKVSDDIEKVQVNSPIY